MDDYRDIGLKRTPQRLAILECLEGNKDHPSAEDIYRTVRKKFPTMSLATVYSTLTALKKRGGVLELTLDPAKKRYDPDTGLHNHLICMSCKKIVDIPGDFKLNLPAGAAQDFSIVKSHVEFFGFCPSCKKDQTKPLKEAANVRRP